jgi:hypothetical protein
MAACVTRTRCGARVRVNDYPCKQDDPGLLPARPPAPTISPPLFNAGMKGTWHPPGPVRYPAVSMLLIQANCPGGGDFRADLASQSARSQSGIKPLEDSLFIPFAPLTLRSGSTACSDYRSGKERCVFPPWACPVLPPKPSQTHPGFRDGCFLRSKALRPSGAQKQGKSLTYSEGSRESASLAQESPASAAFWYHRRAWA